MALTDVAFYLLATKILPDIGTKSPTV